jgi:hypothetical protein
MKIIANPRLCLLYFDFTIGESQYDVEIKQYLDSTKEVEIKVKNHLGDIIEDLNLIGIIKEYSMQKYSIGYDDSKINSGYSPNTDTRLDPPI